MTQATAPAKPARLPRSEDPRNPNFRLAALFDEGSLKLISPDDDSGMLAATGTINGSPAVSFCSDATVMGGAMGLDGCEVVVQAYRRAMVDRVPIIGIWHSGGARLAEGVLSLHAVGRIFHAMTQASGKIPQISVVLGAAAGGAAYGPALTDVVILAPDGRIFVTGPDVVRSVTGEDVDMLRLGGPDTHERKSGVVHVVADDEADALARARAVTTLLAAQGGVNSVVEDVDLAALLPESAKRAYDVHPLIGGLLDEGSVFELHARWAPNVTVAFGRLGGRTVGVVANNPLRLGGCLDSLSAEKAARFVRLCDAFGVPLVVLVDVPGYLPGVGQEWDGVVRRGAKLLHAFARGVRAAGDPGDPQGLRRRLHRHELPLARRHQGVRLAGSRDRRDGTGGCDPDPAPPQAQRGAARHAGPGGGRPGRRAREDRRRRGQGRRDRRGRRDHLPRGNPLRLAAAIRDADTGVRGAHGNIPL